MVNVDEGNNNINTGDKMQRDYVNNNNISNNNKADSTMLNKKKMLAKAKKSNKYWLDEWIILLEHNLNLNIK